MIYFSTVQLCLLLLLGSINHIHAAFGLVAPFTTFSTTKLSKTRHMATIKDQETLSASALRSMTFCNLGKTEEPQLLCDFLMEIGACSTSLIDADRGTPLEQAIYGEPGDATWEKEEDAAVICGDQAVGKNVWNRCNVTAHFPTSTNLEGVAELVESALDLPLAYSVRQVPDRDWVVYVQSSWKPIVVSGLVLRFPWHSNEDVAEAITKQGAKERIMMELRLEGGVAFGTGEHPTTQMCLSWIQQEVISMERKELRLMDYGAGSGVLGLGACALSKRVSAVGVDIDADAVRIANANAVTNKLNMTNYLPPLEETSDSESKSVLFKAHSKRMDESEILPLELNGAHYDACVANILAAPLVTLAPTIASFVQQGGPLGLSGILAQQAQMVIDAYEPYFTDLKVETEIKGWILISGRRREDE